MPLPTTRQCFFLCALWLSIMPAFSAMAGTASQNTPQPVAVTVATVVAREVPSFAVVTGTVQAAEQAAIAAKVSGTIVNMPIQLGSRVKKGDLLVTISAEELTARLNQAEAALAQAKRTLEREQNLLQKNAATPDSAKSAAEQYAIAQGGYREAKTMASYSIITAPFDGVVAQKLLNCGDLVTPGAVLLHLENDLTLQIQAMVPERLFRSIRSGDILIVEVEAAGATIQGTVTEISPAVDPYSRTAVVKLSIPQTPALRSGQFSRIFVPDHRKDSLFVPESALIQSGQMEKVFIVDKGQARLRLVRSGSRHGGMAEIFTGLTAGETVVATNNRHLVDGQTLQVQP